MSDMKKSFDGTNLYFKKDLVENSKAVIVIVHGLAEHLGRYDYVTKYLNDNNFSVYRFDHRGHGKSEGLSTYYSNDTEIYEDTNVFIKMAKEENIGKKVFILGHSMGGMAATTYVSHYQNTVDGAILSGALTRNNANLFTNLPDELKDTDYVPNELSDGVCSDKKVIEDYINDPLVKKEISGGLLRSLTPITDYLKANPDKFIVPALILHGYDDALVSEKDSRDLFSEIASKDKSLHIFAKLQHEILNEPAKDEVLNIITNWINKRI